MCSGAGTSVSVATPANDQVWSEVALSWQSANMSSPAASQDTLYSCRTDRLIWERLLAAVKPVLPDLSVVDVVNNCIDLYMRYTFPTAPLVHEPSLRTAASFFFSDTAPTNVFRTDSGEERVAQLRAFCLVTGLCASIASVIPEDLLPHRRFLTVPFLNASREALAAFEDHDLEHPNSASLTIRSFHSTAMQQNTGKFGAAWHIHSQACLLAQHLRLYSEQTVNQHDALEAHLLRLNFWQLYASDKAASAFRTRPFTLHETLFDEELTLQPYGEQHIFLLDQDRSADNRLLEERLLVGFHLIRTIWSSAASLLSALRSYPRSRTEETRSRLGQEYLDFMGLIDDLPPWLRISKIASPHDDGDVAAAHKPSFWVQRCTVMVTFYCLRLVILQQCVDSDACEVAGFARDQVSTLLVKKFEMIQDFIQTLEDIPFLYLQVKGEPNVSSSVALTVGRRLTITTDREDTAGRGYPS